MGTLKTMTKDHNAYRKGWVGKSEALPTISASGTLKVLGFPGSAQPTRGWRSCEKSQMMIRKEGENKRINT